MCDAADIGLLALVLRNAVFIYFCLSLARTIRIEVSEKRRKFLGLGAPLPRPHLPYHSLSHAFFLHRDPAPSPPPPFHTCLLPSFICVCVWCACLSLDICPCSVPSSSSRTAPLLPCPSAFSSVLKEDIHIQEVICKRHTRTLKKRHTQCDSASPQTEKET